eukprot:SAG31_NODE_28158_length_414_cov_1.968254_1_plen_47_part_01
MLRLLLLAMAVDATPLPLPLPLSRRAEPQDVHTVHLVMSHHLDVGLD